MARAGTRAVGRAVAGRRDRYVIATKFGNLRLPDGSPAVDGRPEYVVKACEASLKRLGVGISTFISSTASTRLCRSRRRSARWGVSSSVGSCVISGCRKRAPRPAPGACGLSDRGAAKRVFLVVARPRRLDARDLPRIGHRLRGLSPIGRGLLGGRSPVSTRSTQMTGAAACRASSPRDRRTSRSSKS